MPTTYGSVLFQDFVPERNATVVERLKGAGAIILAKTTMGEFAASYAGSAFGICRNPYDPAREPAGSSCGSGIGVAASFGAVGIGEDTLGSVRNPAAHASLVGLRPTVPLVSRFGMMPATVTQDTIGPLTRTVRDTALLLNVMAGYDPNDPITAANVGHIPPDYTRYLAADGLRGRRLGVIREPMSESTNPDAEDFAQVRALLDRAVADMAAQGALIVDPAVIPGLRDLLRRSSAGEFEAEEVIDRYLAEHPHAPVRSLREIVMSPQVLGFHRTRLVGGVGHTRIDPGYLQLIRARDELRQAVLSTMADHGLDALVYASVDHLPQLIPDDIMTTSRRISSRGPNRALAPFIGWPAIVVPGGFVDGLPVGIEILGRAWSEGDLIRIAYGYEQATQHRRAPWTTPPLPGEP
jgi:Asp-tRNA(Asn)/Glu-tRNA(Gln) amidotransferase A subunit family amidase